MRRPREGDVLAKRDESSDPRLENLFKILFYR